MADDGLRPDDDTYKSFYERAYRTWWALLKQISTEPELPPGCLGLEHVFPHHPYFPMGLQLDPSGLLTAISTWTPTSECCNMPAFEQRFQLVPTIGRPTPILITTDSNALYQRWFGEEGDGHITVLLLAWAYALSARWTSLISNATPPEYTASRAKWVGTENTSKAEASVVQLGAVSDEAARWWAAVLAPGQGWKASIPHQPYRLLSPWEISLDATHSILLSRTSKPSLSDAEPCPSFDAAVQYIADYSALHAASKQSRAAFAAALLLPLANLDRRKVRLPFPRNLGGTLGAMSHEPIWGHDLRQFDRLLTLSCNPRGIKSLLSSIFYEPGVPCTVCGAWLQGTFALLRSIYTQNLDVLARIFFLRSPHLSFLWLGAIIIGAHKDFLKKPRGLLADEIDLHEAAWSGTIVSFIQNPVPQLPPGARFIARVNEWRLAYLSQGLSTEIFPPLYPYSPPGLTAIDDLDIDVRLHVTCASSHALRFSKISWNCAGGRQEVQEVTGEGAIHRGITFLPQLNRLHVKINYDHLDREMDLSEVVTRTVFNWMRGTEGFPIAERHIYKHEWLDGFNSDDESIHARGGGGSTAGSNAPVRAWISKSLTTRCNSI